MVSQGRWWDIVLSFHRFYIGWQRSGDVRLLGMCVFKKTGAWYVWAGRLLVGWQRRLDPWERRWEWYVGLRRRRR